jgi:hypothetical protein
MIIRQLPPTPAEMAYTQRCRIDHAHKVALAQYAMCGDRHRRDTYRRVIADRSDTADLNGIYASLFDDDDVTPQGYFRAVVRDRLHELALDDDVFTGDDGDAHAEMAAHIRHHELALRDPAADATWGVYVGMIDEPCGTAAHAMIEERR